jgi:uncharacterized protein
MEDASAPAPISPAPSGELLGPVAENPEVIAPVTIEEPAQPWLPTQPDERISLIDILRGLALFGILLANIRGFGGPLATYFRTDLLWKTTTDFWVQAFVDTFIQGKFITLFAFLFGVGFAVQFTRAEKRHSKFAFTYMRRLLALLFIGALHQLLFWWGDILVSYALGGFLLIPFRKRKNKTILIWALSLMLVPLVGGAGYSIYGYLRPDSPAKTAEKQKEQIEKRKKTQAEVEKTVREYQTSGYAAIFKSRLGDLKQENSSQPIVVLLTVPIFLLGFWVWRRGVFQDPAAHRDLLKRGLIVGLIAGIPANIAFVWGSRVVSSQNHTGPPTAMMVGLFVLVLFGRPVLSMAYACAIGLLFLRPQWRERMMPFAAIGRTALSNYLLQTIVCTTLFYGYGGGLFGKLSLLELFVPAVVLYGLEVPLSNWWLARYRFGPAEWAWRSMTYGKRPGMKYVTTPTE